jgi:hypothetical protein
MDSERGQASVEWVALLLLVALGMGGLIAFAPQVDGRSLGGLLAHRITCAAARDCEGDGEAGPRPGPSRREAASIAPVAPVTTRIRGRPRDVIKVGVRKAIAWNGLACYLRKSTAGEDTNRVSDDVGDALNCFNPLNGWTGTVGGTDD